MAKQLKSRNKKLEVKWQKDYLFSSYWMTKFINVVMRSGKKQSAMKVIFYALNQLKKELGGINDSNAFLLFFELLQKVRPTMAATRFKKGNGKKRKVYFIPVPIFVTKAYKLGLRWIKRSLVIRKSKRRKRENRLFKHNYSLKKRIVKKKEIKSEISHTTHIIREILLRELLLIFDNQNSLALRIKEDHYLRLYQNRTFFHFRWK